MSTEATMTETTTTTEGSTSEPTTTTDTASETGSQQQEQQQATESQTTDEAATKTAPETYEIKAPEGVEIAEPVTAKFADIAKKHALTQEAAQELFGELTPLIAQHQAETMASLQRTWVEQATVDKEIGGAKLEENMGIAKRTFTQFGTPALGELLVKTGLANHPEMLRWAYRVSLATSEDRMDGGAQRSNQTGPADPAKVLFPNQA